MGCDISKETFREKESANFENYTVLKFARFAIKVMTWPKNKFAGFMTLFS